MVDDKQQQPSGIGLGLIVYQQIASVLGAFALIAFLENLVHIDWKEGLAYLVGVWDAFVRPAVKFAFDVTLVALAKWAFNWSVEVPVIVRDYASVGIAHFLSTFRMWMRVGLERGETLSSFGTRMVGQSGFVFRAFMVNLFAWPYVLVATALAVLGWGVRRYNAKARLRAAVILSPIFYLVFLLAVNELILI
jgi:hypothetical protein